MIDYQKELDRLKQELQELQERVDIKKRLNANDVSKHSITELKVFAKKQMVLFVSNNEELIGSISDIKNYFLKFVVIDSTNECVECMNESFDIIVVDIDLDDNCGGFEMIDKIKSSYPTKILVALSRKFSYDLVVKMLDLKVDGFLLFPYTQEELTYMFAKYSEKVVYKDIFTDFKIEEKIKHRLLEERRKLERSLISSGEKYKTSAKEYVNHIMEDIDLERLLFNLDEIIEESNDLELILLDIIENDIYAKNVRQKAIEFFTHAEKIFFDMKEFDEVGLAFGELIIIFERLSDQSIKEIENDVFKHIYLLNKNFIDTLNNILINQTTGDIHELDDEYIKGIYSIKEELGFIDDSTFQDEELAKFIL